MALELQANIGMCALPARHLRCLQERHLSGLRVLLVEDDPDSRELAILALSLCGAAVIVVESAREAVAELAGADAVVTGLAMPGHDGHWLLQHVLDYQVAKADRAIPVIAVTTHADSYTRRAALARGFREHMTKPFTAIDLCAAVARAVGRSH
jgi:CheY-like chemotaxis protein